jgi:hypothetical protein
MVKDAVEDLKVIHAGLKSASSAQITEFNSLYRQLSVTSKESATTEEELASKLVRIKDLSDRISELRYPEVVEEMVVHK